MSVFGKWECPNCETTWTGSIGWNPPIDIEGRNKLLHNMCGCSGPIEGAETPVISASVMNVKISDKRKAMNLDIDKSRAEEGDAESAGHN